MKKITKILNYLPAHRFATKFNQKYPNLAYDPEILTPNIQFRNYNMCINKPELDILFFVFHPKVIKKSPSFYEIKRYNIVLAMTIVEKHQNISDQMRWQNRKTMTFNFLDLGKILNVSTGKGKSALIVSSRNDGQISNYKKQLLINDIPDSESVQFQLKYLKSTSADSNIYQEMQVPLTIKITYNQYRIIHELIKNNLFEVSGWKFQMQLQRQQYLDKIQTNSKIDDDLDNFTRAKIIKNKKNIVNEKEHFDNY